MMEAYYDDGTAFTIGDAFSWLSVIDVLKDSDVNYYSGLIEKDQFDTAIEELSDLDMEIATRLVEVLTGAKDTTTEHVVID